MFFESSKLNHVHQTKTNRIRNLRQICLLTIIISLLNISQVHSSKADQLEHKKSQGDSRFGAEHDSLRPIVNEREKVSGDKKAQELFVLYKALIESDSDKLSLRHRRTLPGNSNFNESFERSYDRGEDAVSPIKPHETEIDPSSIRTYPRQTTPLQSGVEEGAIIHVANGPDPLGGELQPASADPAVASVSVNQVSSGLGAFLPALPKVRDGFHEAEYQPSLAELTAAGTAAGLMMSDLAVQADSSEDSPGFEEGLVDSPDNSGIELYKGLDQVIAKSSLPLRAQNLPELSHREDQSGEDQQPAHESPDSMPESIESLMGVDGQEESIDQNENNQQQQTQPRDTSASNQIPEESGDPLLVRNSAINMKPKSNGDDDGDKDNYDEEDDDDDDKRIQSTLIPAHLPVMNRRGALSVGGDNQLALMHNLPGELNTAAGHYKKKKVKKVKKVVIKKKVKKKKVKKVKKVVKYKKKKKPKKKHHHHHDHGKYYMYAKVPKKKAWEFGFKKGNKKHWISRHEKGYKNKFKTKVKWYDKKSKGKGVHIWDYNHHDKKKYG